MKIAATLIVLTLILGPIIYHLVLPAFAFLGIGGIPLAALAIAWFIFILWGDGI